MNLASLNQCHRQNRRFQDNRVDGAVQAWLIDHARPRIGFVAGPSGETCFVACRHFQPMPDMLNLLSEVLWSILDFSRSPIPTQ